MLTNRINEVALLKAYAAGDFEASAVLVGALAPRLVSFSSRMLGGDQAEAEDVTQETLLRLWKAAENWDEAGSALPSTWAFRVASNLCIDRMRRHGKFSDDADIPSIPDDRLSADAQLQQVQRVSALDLALLKLPERQRLAVVFRHIEGWANADIAASMDITIEAVESLTARGKKALQSILAAQREALSHVE